MRFLQSFHPASFSFFTNIKDNKIIIKQLHLFYYKIFIYAFIICLSSLSIFSQNGGKPLSISQTIDLPDSNVDLLKINARMALRRHYQSWAQNYHTNRFRADGSMFFSPNVFFTLKNSEGIISYDLKIETFDNRYILTFTKFNHIANIKNIPPISFGRIIENEVCMTSEESNLIMEKQVRPICESVFEQIEKHTSLIINTLSSVSENAIWEYNTLLNAPATGIIYEGEITLDGISKNEIYVKCFDWMDKNFNVDYFDLGINNEDKGIFAARAGFEYFPNVSFGFNSIPGDLEYIVRFLIDEGNLSYEIFDFYHYAKPNDTQTANSDYGLIAPNTEDCLEKAPLTMTKKRKGVVCEDINKQINKKVDWLISSLNDLNKAPNRTNAEWEIQPNNGEWLLYSDIKKIANKSKEDLFNQTKKWLDSKSTEIRFTIESADADAGIIKGHAEMPYKPPVLKFGLLTTGIVRYDWVLSVKDGAYNYLFKNFIHEPQVRKEMKPLNLGRVSNQTPCFQGKQLAMTKKQKEKVCTYMKEEIDKHINGLIMSYSRFLN